MNPLGAEGKGSVRFWLALVSLSGWQAALAGTDIVELMNGDRLTGAAKSLDRGKLQIDDGGFGDVDVRMSLGYTYPNAGNVSQLNVGLDSAHRTRQRILSGNFASSISNSSGNESSQRQTLSGNYPDFGPTVG